ncbi:MAG: hypothetical protein IPI58_09625 [Alphaproteobacteria bacterium]|nr:MAG: hypothetical protein IPI58_09625 [Alphaproteobacteria bacterium]
MSSSHEDKTSLHSEFMAFVTDDESAKVLQDYARSQSMPESTVQYGGPDLVVQLLSNATPPGVLVVDIDGHEDPVEHILPIASMCANIARVIAIGSINDVRLYHDLLANGIVDYLVKPLSVKLLAATVDKAQRAAITGAAAERRPGRFTIICGARGGVGASTVAVNVAWLCAHELKINTLLWDLDLHYGISALALDLEPGRGLRELLETPTRVDGLMVASSLISESDKLSVLGSEEALEASFIFDSMAGSALLRELRGHFDMILLDMPRWLLPGARSFLAEADSVMMVGDFSLISIRDINRVKDVLKGLGNEGTAPPPCILAAYGGNRDAGRQQIDQATFERGVQGKLDYLLPDDGKGLREAANLGKALGEVMPNSPLVTALRPLAQRLSGVTPKTATKNAWFGIGKKPA